MQQKVEQIQSELRAKSRARSVLTWIFQLLLVIVFGIFIGMIFFHMVTMQESYMDPTFSTGDVFFVNQAAYKIGNPKRGDIIAFTTTDDDEAAVHIKRVIGLPGETIQIKDGMILIDGATYIEGMDLPTINSPGLAEEGVHLSSGEYFVLGDNRNNSEDSRYAEVGNVKKKNIVGKVWFQVLPLSRLGGI